MEFPLYPVPMWAIGAIVVVVLALVACLGFCIYKKCINKGKKPKKARERKAGRGRRKKDKEGEDGEEKKVRENGNQDNSLFLATLSVLRECFNIFGNHLLSSYGHVQTRCEVKFSRGVFTFRLTEAKCRLTAA